MVGGSALLATNEVVFAAGVNRESVLLRNNRQPEESETANALQPPVCLWGICMCVFIIFLYLYVCIYVYVYVHAHAYVNAYMYIYAYANVYMHLSSVLSLSNVPWPLHAVAHWSTVRSCP